MSILIIGAHGKIGRLLTEKLAATGQTPLCMIRSDDQAATIRQLGGEPIIADLEDDFDDAFEDADTVIFTAGSGASTGGDKTLLVDLWGAIKSIDICRKFGIQRYIMVSALKAADPDGGPEKMRHYLVAKHIADDYLQRAGLDYTIVRPGRLLDDEPTGRIQAEEWLGDQTGSIPRADVADTIIACLNSDNTQGKTFDLISGDTPIADAVAAI